MTDEDGRDVVPAAVAELVAADPRLRCRCCVRTDGGLVSRCPDVADGEDGLCSHCRSCDSTCAEARTNRICCATHPGAFLVPFGSIEYADVDAPAPF